MDRFSERQQAITDLRNAQRSVEWARLHIRNAAGPEAPSAHIALHRALHEIRGCIEVLDTAPAVQHELPMS